MRRKRVVMAQKPMPQPTGDVQQGTPGLSEEAIGMAKPVKGTRKLKVYKSRTK